MTAETRRRLAVAAALTLAVAACAAPTFEPAGQGTQPPTTPPPPTTVETTTAPPTTRPPNPTSTDTPPPARFSPTFLLDDVLATLGIVAVDPTGTDPTRATAVAGRTLWTDPEGGTQTRTFVITTDGSHRIETTGSRIELLTHDAATMTTEYWDPELALVITGLPTAGPDGTDGFVEALALHGLWPETPGFSDGEPVAFNGLEAVKVVFPPPDPEEAEEFDGPLGPTTVIYEATTGFPLLVDRPDLTVETVALRFLDPTDLNPAWFRLDLPDEAITARTQREWTKGTTTDLPEALRGVTVAGIALTDVFVAIDGRSVVTYRSGFDHIDLTWIPDDLHRGLDPYNPDNLLPAPGTVTTVTDFVGLRVLDRRPDGLVVVTGTDPNLVTAAAATLRP